MRERVISCNEYALSTCLKARGEEASLERMLTVAREAGYGAFEPFAHTPEQIVGVARAAESQGLRMPSIYVNSRLHTEGAEGSLKDVVAIARAARAHGVELVVTNPEPVEWGGRANKNDGELAVQARALEALGGALKELGLTLAYHHHDAEFRAGGREVHHMLVRTDPELVKVCMDPDWIWRGTEFCVLAVADFVELYGERTVEVHLRQSQKRVWREVFGAGDLDWVAICGHLRAKARGEILWAMEQAAQEGTATELSAVEAQWQSREALAGMLA